MLKFPKFLTALALAAALGPFAASARGDHASVQDANHQEYLVGTFTSGQPSAASSGRAAAANAPAGLVTVSSTEYAAAAAVAYAN